MKTIQIVGMGCAKCNRLYEHAEEAAKRLGIQYRMEKVSDINKIAEMGIMSTPAMAIDGKVVLSGRVPTVESLMDLLR